MNEAPSRRFIQPTQEPLVGCVQIETRAVAQSHRDLDLYGEFGLVSVRCSNLGEATGPYPKTPDVRCPGETADRVPVANSVTANSTKPAMDAAKSGGVALFHLVQHAFARSHPQDEMAAEDCEPRPPSPAQPVGGCVSPWPLREQWRGTAVATKSVPTFPGLPGGRTQIDSTWPRLVRPLPDEEPIRDSWEFNGLCRRLEIDAFFDVGSTARLSLVSMSGAVREVGSGGGYRCAAIRDCATAH